MSAFYRGWVRRRWQNVVWAVAHGLHIKMHLDLRNPQTQTLCFYSVQFRGYGSKADTAQVFSDADTFNTKANHNNNLRNSTNMLESKECELNAQLEGHSRSTDLHQGQQSSLLWYVRLQEQPLFMSGFFSKTVYHYVRIWLCLIISALHLLHTFKLEIFHKLS